MVPTNAYVTLEHEYILVFRKGPPREFEPGADRRYEAAYFWEERNRWFSDVWTDVTGDLQALDHDELRERSAAFPFEIPYRLINMYSVYGDTVLDPFWGTGTTTLAAMVAGRDSVGRERDPAFLERFADRVGDVPSLGRDVVAERLAAHRAFVADRFADDSHPPRVVVLDHRSEMSGQTTVVRALVVRHAHRHLDALSVAVRVAGLEHDRVGASLGPAAVVYALFTGYYVARLDPLPLGNPLDRFRSDPSSSGP
jgi:hypothetical protein